MSIKDIYAAVLEFDSDQVVKLVKEEISRGTEIPVILNDGLISAMDEVGRLFSAGDLFVPEMLLAAQAMKAGLDQLKPYMKQEDSRTKGTIVIGTVKGDLHDIGKNLVAMMMEGAGFEVIDLGIDVDTEKFIQAAEEHKADIICMSALLTTTMPEMKVVVDTLKERGLNYKTMVGGAPVSQEFADQIGADGYSPDAP
ncbi:MAG TPA: cobalamin-binding protein, partial [Syntrophomonadaceae bacterium]|nr:cobalamin-binding protein [Syntrophomonadaceae bacterium]